MMSTSLYNQYWKYADVVKRAIVLNVLVFLVLVLTNLLAFLFMHVKYVANAWVELPAHWPALLTHPWTFITYQFAHFGLFHLLFNLLVLHFAGAIFMDYFKSKQFWTLYLMGGLAGALSFLLLTHSIPMFNPHDATLVGASASIMAILFAASVYAPNIQLKLFGFIDIKLKWIAVLYLVIDLMGVLESNAGGHIAHIGGAIVGALFAYNQKHLWFQKPSKLKVVKPSTIQHNQAEIDAILDKISKYGYDRLSQAEKDKLFKASQE